MKKIIKTLYLPILFLTLICVLSGPVNAEENPTNNCRHKHTEIQNKKEETCLEDGYCGDTVCLDCGKTIWTGHIISKLNHKMMTYYRELSTCQKEGHYAYFICEYCHYMFSDYDGKNIITEPITVPKVPHDFTYQITKPATCLNEGQKTGTCRWCGTKETITIPKSGHNMVFHNKINATSTKTGTESYYQCSTCKKMFKDYYGKNPINAPTVIPKKSNYEPDDEVETRPDPKWTIKDQKIKISRKKLKKGPVTIKAKKITKGVKCQSTSKLTYKLDFVRKNHSAYGHGGMSYKTAKKYVKVSKNGTVTIKKLPKQRKILIGLQAQAPATKKYKKSAMGVDIYLTIK